MQSPHASRSPVGSPKALPHLKLVRNPGLVFPLSESLVLSMNLRLKTLDPFLLQRTRPLPQTFQPVLKARYSEVEHIQTLMPEIADSRFNISDLLHPEMTPDQFFLNSYFLSSHKDPTDSEWSKAEEAITSSLALHRLLLRHRIYFKMLFVSYNMEAMSAVTDMLSMDFATFVKLMKDGMLLTPAFDLIAAAKVFYLSCVQSKELQYAENAESERKWFKHLLNSYNFKANYRLRLSNFLESLVRLTYFHPRFSKMTALRPSERLDLLYKRCLKPFARLTQGHFYSSLLKDIHVTDILSQFENSLYEIFQGYTVKLTTNEKLLDFVGKDKKMDLNKYYSFLSNAGILMEAEIMQVGNADIEEEIDKLNDIPTIPDHRRNGQFSFKQNQSPHANLKETAIRFPSSMFERVENKLIKIKASRNTRLSGSGEVLLLPFPRPIRSVFAVDKLTAFSFFTSVMQSTDALYLLNPKALSDVDFCIDFREFVDLVGMLGILYWKSVTRCLDMSLVEGLATFLKTVIEKFKYMREFRGFAPAEKDKLALGLLKLRLGPLSEVQQKPLITKTMLPQDRFIQRRDSV